jgi:uncharacterized protein (TIGR02757 family)
MAKKTLRFSKEFLEDLYRTHHRIENLSPDPLIFTRGFADPAQGEVAGLIAASLAYGRVELIVVALGKIFTVLGPRPRDAILESPPERWLEAFDNFAYRFHKGRDLAIFFLLLSRTLEQEGNLRELFAANAGRDTGAALTAFCTKILAQDPRPLLASREIPSGHPVRFLLASPATGSAAKRMCLYLRWMIRRDQLDPGYWSGVLPPSRLVVPLDTHVARVSRLFGLSHRQTPDWKTACEITENLRRFDPSDPLRYDFSLFRYGMSGDYPSATPDSAV